jgi:hypothetical protein
MQTTNQGSDLLTAARSEAVFVSTLSAHAEVDADQVAAAIRCAIRMHGGSHGCAAEVAREYGDYPETAPARMRWALAVVAAVYPRRRGARC